MRILISTWGWRSHFYGLVPLGQALQAAGHDVRVAGHPALTADITAAGLAAVPLGADLDFATVFAGSIDKVGRLDGAGDPEAGSRRPTADAARGSEATPLEPAITADGGVVRFADALLDELVAYGRYYRPDLMLWEPFNLAAPIAAAALDVPGVFQHWGPDSSTTLRLDREAVLGPLAARFGRTAEEIRLTGMLALDPVPAPMQVPLTGPVLPIRFVPYNGPAVLPAWLREPPRRPRICVTAGTMMAGAGLTERLGLAETVRTLAELDAELVVLVERSQQSSLGRLPANVRVADAPLALRLVLPTCAALVQQGGAGTTMTALACGVPQLVLPRVSDQHFNAERLALTGAGTWIDPVRADHSTLRGLVADVAEPGGTWQRAASAMRDRIAAAPAPAELVPALLDLARSGRG